LGNIDSLTKYELITKIYKKIPTEIQSNFIQRAYEIATEEWKYRLLLDYNVPNPDMELIKRWYVEEQKDFDFSVISHIPKEAQVIFCDFYLKQIESIDNEEKYRQTVKLYNNLQDENKVAFIKKAYEIVNQTFKILILQFFKPENTETKQNFEKWLFASSFLLLKPQKNKYYSVPLIDLMNIDILYVKKEFEVFENQIINTIRDHLFDKLSNKTIPSETFLAIKNFTLSNPDPAKFEEYLSENEESEENKIKIVLNVKQLNKYLRSPFNTKFFKKFAEIFISNIRQELDYYLRNQYQLVIKLIDINKIDEENTKKLLNDILLYLDTYSKMILWLHDVYDVFDYNYGYFYFILKRNEKMIFNQKAKKYMEDEVNKLILAQRIPCDYIKTDEKGVKYYSASWRSIWFLNKQIRFCLEEVNDEKIFSEPYEWFFSEEKLRTFIFK
jgi:uncharacterized protein (DUF2164 family)